MSENRTLALGLSPVCYLPAPSSGPYPPSALTERSPNSMPSLRNVNGKKKRHILHSPFGLESVAGRGDGSQTRRFLRRNKVYACVRFCGYVCTCVTTHRAKVSLANALMCGVRSPEIIQTRHQDWTGGTGWGKGGRVRMVCRCCHSSELRQEPLPCPFN